MTVTVAEPDARYQQLAILQYARACIMSGLLDPTSRENPDMWAFAADTVAQLLRPGRSVYGVDWLRDVDDAFGCLCDVVAREAAFDADPDGFLASIPRPQTAEFRDIVRGALLADRVHWLQRLLDLS